jgi:hypothetical protein
MTGMICSMLLIGGSAQAQAPQPAFHSTSLEQSVKHFLQTSDDGKYKTESHVVAFPDLNGDGKPEAIVYLTGREWCGSGGCHTIVLAQKGHSWKVVGKITVAYRPISVLKNVSYGWHSIGFWVRWLQGGVPQAFEAELRFDGKKYHDLSPPHLIKLSKPVPEIVVIPEPPLTDAQKADSSAK